jgi:uncharacterized protein YbjQ (UPF0145 family)
VAEFNITDMIDLFFNIVLPLGLIVVGYVAGSFIEARHYKSIQQREKALLNLPAIPMTLKEVIPESEWHTIKQAELVCASVVLTEDGFKAALAWFQSLFGGRLACYENLLDRARREAILRIKAQARGATLISNLRLDTSSIGKQGGAQGGGIKTIEVMASGTAIYLHKA